MPDSADFAAPALDDRSPYVAARVVLTAIAANSDELPTEEAVEEAIKEAQGPASQFYVDVIKQTNHSVFYHQLQQFYEFGQEHVRPDARDGFCLECGRIFIDATFAENIHEILQMALARRDAFRATVIRMFKAQIYNYAGEKYLVSAETTPDDIILRISYRNPEVINAYLEKYALDPVQCFRNSFELIGGATNEFTSKIVDDYDPSRFRLSCSDLEGTYHLPVGENHGFAYQSLIALLVSYVTDLKGRQEKVRADDRLESDLIIESPLMRDTWNRIRRAGRSEEIVLLRGESGTGKSFIARKIHESSPRKDKAFVEVGLTSDLGSDNMLQSDLFGHERGAFTGADTQKNGLFSLANDGTIFLDEIGDASADLQARLLRVLETGTFKRLGGVEDIKVDVRVITATNQDLEQMVSDGTFRRDLYYRINVIPVQLPALRERLEEIPALAEFLLARAQARGSGHNKCLIDGLAEQLSGYDWPGNIRELDHALKHAVAMAEGQIITAIDMPQAVREGLGAPRIGGHEPQRGVRATGSGLIDLDSLRRHIKKTSPVEIADGRAYRFPAHVDYAKRAWLSTLIDECGGDLSLMSSFWDRDSEKTLRKLVREYELADALALARKRRGKS